MGGINNSEDNADKGQSFEENELHGKRWVRSDEARKAPSVLLSDRRCGWLVSTDRHVHLASQPVANLLVIVRANFAHWLPQSLEYFDIDRMTLFYA